MPELLLGIDLERELVRLDHGRRLGIDDPGTRASVEVRRVKHECLFAVTTRPGGYSPEEVRVLESDGWSRTGNSAASRLELRLEVEAPYAGFLADAVERVVRDVWRRDEHEVMFSDGRGCIVMTEPPSSL